jgi:cell division protein FtsW (lipid II flippase)
MFGLGPGTSRARWGSLPSAYSDFISAIIGEEYGFVGYIVFVFILSVSVISFFLIAIRQKNEITDTDNINTNTIYPTNPYSSPIIAEIKSE